VRLRSGAFSHSRGTLHTRTGSLLMAPSWAPWGERTVGPMAKLGIMALDDSGQRE
jgi:hypothetical protein